MFTSVESPAKSRAHTSQAKHQKRHRRSLTSAAEAWASLAAPLSEVETAPGIEAAQAAAERPGP